MRKTWIPMPAEIALEDATVVGSIEDSAPRFQFVNARRRFLRMQFRHARVVHVLSTAHRIREMHHPVVSIVDVTHGGRSTTFRHHGVRLAEQGLAYQSNSLSG
jgi:hypothetical protein